MNSGKSSLYLAAFFLLYFFWAGCARKSADKKDYLYKIVEGKFDEFGVKTGYVNSQGDTVIALGKYLYCYSDTLKNYAVVMKNSGDIVAIDKSDSELFKVFKYDNGPDYFSEGLFRIVKNGKIGYADRDGNIIIEPQFVCAFPFNSGRAKVSTDCNIEKNGEHLIWQSENWFYIDKTGKKINDKQ
jgi:hypothetical protein